MKAQKAGNALIALLQDFQDRLERIEKMIGETTPKGQEPPEPPNHGTETNLRKETIEAAIPVVEFLLQYPDEGRFVMSIATSLNRSESSTRRLMGTLEEHLPFLTHTMQGGTKNYLIKKRQVSAARKWVKGFKKQTDTPPPPKQDQGEATLTEPSPGHFELHCPSGKVRKSTRRRDLVAAAKKMGLTIVDSESKPKLALVQ
jgi:hypothetical protein